ncbi:glycoside hydrolase [Flavobacterium faecale]|uniref:Glycoside hydrolase n=1 Tax=Flavobacterium faecale TaxID=1355330 RepID=A0A2S1LCD7_9FLAO|nr:C40 family peptidase [Flavobacterium faecale]AWG21216.1 glycoside hydrolase [Flavobacterium faecale]
MKNLFCLLALALLFASCKSGSSVTTRSRTSYTLADKIVTSASKHLGAPYRTAGKTAAGYDCSGLVYSTFGEFDIALPRTSYNQAKTGKELGQNTKKAEKGDLIFFITNNGSRINHVGIVTDTNEGEVKFIHASTSKGVIISSMSEPYYQKTFTQLNRILE